MSIEYRFISAEEMENAGAEELFQAHWNEVPLINNEDIGVKLDWPKYKELEAGGHVAALAAYDGKNVVGYLVALADRMQQHDGYWVAQSDVIYVDPAYRDRKLAINMIKQMETYLKKSGVHFFQIMVNMTYDFSALPEALGYDHAYKVYNKRLV